MALRSEKTHNIESEEEELQDNTYQNIIAQKAESSLDLYDINRFLVSENEEQFIEDDYINSFTDNTTIIVTTSSIEFWGDSITNTPCRKRKIYPDLKELKRPFSPLGIRPTIQDITESLEQTCRILAGDEEILSPSIIVNKSKTIYTNPLRRDFEPHYQVLPGSVYSSQGPRSSIRVPIPNPFQNCLSEFFTSREGTSNNPIRRPDSPVPSESSLYTLTYPPPIPPKNKRQVPFSESPQAYKPYETPTRTLKILQKNNPQPSTTAEEKMAVVEPKVFLGDGTQSGYAWIRRFEMISQGNGWNTSINKIKKLGSYLEGQALDWYIRKRYDPAHTNWVDVKSDFLFEFDPDSNDKMGLDYQLSRTKLKPGDNPINYYQKVMQLCSLLDPQMDEGRKLRELYRGLDEVKRHLMLLAQPQDTEEFWRKLIIINQSLGFSKLYNVEEERKEKVIALLEQDSDFKKNEKGMTELMRALMLDIASLKEEIKYLKERTPNQNFRNQRPYGMGPNPNNTRTIDGRPKCFTCNRPGHIARDCFRNRTSNYNTNNTNSDRENNRPPPNNPSRNFNQGN